METEQKQDEYEVGYGKPPRHTRFRKGESGNYRGRPKTRKNLTTIVGEVLGDAVVINENGRRRRRSKAEVIAMQLVNKAVKGDSRTTQFLISFLEKHPELIKEDPKNLTVEELDSKVNLLRDSVKVLRDLGVLT